MMPLKLIQSFVEERLDGNLDKLATYELTNLRNDEVYGNPGRYFDPDDTELMRAIYCVVFENAWPNISENIKAYKLRGDTLNTFATMFGRISGDYLPELHPGLDKYNPSGDLVTIVEDFYRVCWTIGNMTVLPNIPCRKNTMNQYRGCHPVWHDYEDRFLLALYIALTDGEPKDKGLMDILDANKSFFLPYYGPEGWKKFVDAHFLNIYVDENYMPVISSKGYYFWRNYDMTDEQYLQEAKRYCSFATHVIHNRANHMMDIVRCRI